MKWDGEKYTMLTNIDKAGVAMLISDKADFRIKDIIRSNKWHYIMTKGPILQEDKTVLGVYTHKNRMPIYMRKKLIDIQRKIN